MRDKITAADFITEVENKVETKMISDSERKFLLQSMVDILDKINESRQTQKIIIRRKHNHLLSVESDSYVRYFFDNGVIAAEEWFSENETHRGGDMPARIIYDKKGNKRVATWFIRNAVMRNGGKPAVMNYGTSDDEGEGYR